MSNNLKSDSSTKLVFILRRAISEDKKQPRDNSHDKLYAVLHEEKSKDDLERLYKLGGGNALSDFDMFDHDPALKSYFRYLDRSEYAMYNIPAGEAGLLFIKKYAHNYYFMHGGIHP